ncbi:hypothetical protein DSM104299_00119 [Baekduia alba]|uniref:helix-turn-helix domain-containing protein n=1 Tax=Baekduia alba TaxID=2997333 RepID=UPI00233F7C80|nr:helix-turn-helix domain-containing protein [Baekduia alba]WCB91448.1 hypothetical protein DSM104299_00119 [Baekduia alba]
MSRLIALLRADLTAMTDATEAIVHREHPELVARVGTADVRLGVAHTHERFVAILDDTAPDDRARHIAFGAATAAAGASVEELMAAYRIGAQVGWRRVLAFAADLDLPGDVALTLASKSMAYMDELAANSLEGFAREAEAAQGARARARQALLDALLDGRGDDADALAAAAGWPLPARLRVAVLLSAEGHRFDDRILLLGRADGVAVAVAREEDADALLAEELPLAAGPAVAADQAPLSLARARRLAALARAGVLPADRPHRWEDHLADLIVHADAGAGEALVAARLDPLRDASPARERLLRETLQAWLDHPGRPREIAKALHLHHQTVRYRLTRLRERLGDDLDDPSARFELGLALRLAA